MTFFRQPLTSTLSAGPTGIAARRYWLLSLVIIVGMIGFDRGLAPAADYRYRFDDVQVSETDNSVKFVFEISEVLENGVAAAGTEIQAGDYIPLRFQVKSGSAKVGSDFIFNTDGAGYKEVVLFPGESKTNVLVHIIDDQLLDPDETFFLHVEAVSGEGEYDSLSGNQNTATATILDNELGVTFLTDGNGTVDGKPSLVQILGPGDPTTPVTPEPKAGPPRYRFEKWIVDDGVKPIDVFFAGMIIGDVRTHMTATAVFVPIQHEVSFRAGAGGHLDGGQMEIIQMVDDTAAGKVVSAVADAGYRFDGWEVISGAGNADISGDDLAALTVAGVTGPLTIEARFVPDAYTLEVAVNAPSGEPFGPSSVTIDPRKDTYKYGDTVTLTANPGTGTRFGNWTGPSADQLPADDPLSITIKSDVFLTANFVKLPVTLVMQTEGIGAGSTLPQASEAGLAHTYEWGDSVLLSAAPEISSEFEGWSSNVQNGVIEMIGDQIVIASFKLKQFAVTVSAGDNGTLQNANGLIQDSFTVPVAYGTNTSVIDAIADACYRFDGWEVTSGIGNAVVDADNPALRVTDLTGPLTIEAKFARIEYAFEINVEAPIGGAFGQSSVSLDPLKGTYYCGDTVALKANPGEGAQFGKWSGSGADNLPSGESGSIRIKSDVFLTAHFVKLPATLIMQTEGAGTGETDPQGTKAGLAHTYQWGDSVLLSAIPEISSEFVGWSENVQNDVIEMTGDQTVIARFKPRQFSVIVSAGKNGTLQNDDGSTSDSFTLPVNYGKDASPINAIADTCYRFDGWEVKSGVGNAVVVDASPVLSVTDVTGPLTVEARFERIEYAFEVNADAPVGEAFGQSSVSIEPGKDTYYCGDTVTLTATAGKGAQFSEWSGSGVDSLPFDKMVSLTINSDVSLTANFVKKPVTLVMKIEGNGAGETDPQGSESGLAHTYKWGDGVRVSAEPDLSSEFGGWSGNAQNHVVEMIGDQTVVASFTLKQFTVTVNAGDNGILKDANGVTRDSFTLTVNYGQDSLPIDAIPDDHYLFEGWRTGMDQDVFDTADRLVLSDVTSDVILAAEFVIQTFTVSFDPAGYCTLRDESGEVYEGVYNQVIAYGEDALAVTAEPLEERSFEGWFLNGEVPYESSETIRVTHVTNDMIFTPNSRADIDGCALPVNCPFVSGFEKIEDDLDLINVAIDGNGYLALQTGPRAINPDEIVIPFQQTVYVTFLYENAGFQETDFGWIDPEQVKDPAKLHKDKRFNKVKHQIYENINDNNNNGVLDGVTDRNRDSRINRHDNRVKIGEFDGGEKIVFYLDSRDNNPEDGDCSGACGGLFFTKRTWNERHGRCIDSGGISRLIQLFADASDNFECQEYVAACGAGVHTQGWLDADARDRLKDEFGFNFRSPIDGDPDGFNTECVDDGSYASGADFATHAIGAAPDETPFAWILGFDDSTMDDPDESNDYDYNDIVFVIERQSGGSARLLEPFVPEEADAYYTAVEFEVYDHHPGEDCAGKTRLRYKLSVDGGKTWPLEVTEWDEVFEYTLEDNRSKTLGKAITPVSDWTPGDPADTFRKVRFDLAGGGITGRQLLWKVDMISGHEACLPKVIDVQMNAETATHDSFSRAAPVVQANVIYSGFFQTPAPTWSEKAYRGKLTANLIYDPRNPDQPAAPENRELWDAGEVLAATHPDERTIYFPDIALVQVSGEQFEDGQGNPLTGDGETRTFSGRLEHYPVVATTVRIGSAVETFTDLHTDDLKGSLNGTGTINRFTGEWEITFTHPPGPDDIIQADYSHYSASSTLKGFEPDNVDRAMLALTDEFVYPHGYSFDLDGDDQLSEADADWLVKWVRGYRQPNTGQKKSWLLGPVDHSVPAVLTPPGKPEWYLIGGSVGADELNSYGEFRKKHAHRNTVVFVGARDGMLHAFEAGKFRHGDNPETHINSYDIEEQRGYFLWEEKTDDSPAYCDSFEDKCPDYGSGHELWAFIPANLMPRLKYNYLMSNDQAYVDASPALADVYIDTDGDGRSWRTILLAAQGNGGDTVFCLDVTDPETPSFLWEFAAPELFRSRSSPAVSRVGRIFDPDTKDSKWVAFFVTGKVSDQNRNAFPAIYMIDLSNGNVLKRIVLDDELELDLDGDGSVTDRDREHGRGGLLSGQPALVDTNYNGFVDRLYVASNRGFLYKIRLPDHPQEAQDGITHMIANSDFTAAEGEEAGNTVPEAQRWHPIYGSPAVFRQLKGIDENGELICDVLIFFGTGDSPYYDEDIDTANTKYHFFAYRDGADTLETDADAIDLEWFIELPAGHRVFASAFAAAGTIYFGTSTAETEDPCEGHGQVSGNLGRIYAFDLEGTQRLNKIVGDVRTTPLVEDEHLYFRTPIGLRSLGSGHYNRPMDVLHLPQIGVRMWHGHPTELEE